MKIVKNKTIATLFALILMLTTIIGVFVVSAHTPPWTCPTYAYVSLSPSTVGVGQYTNIIMWLNVFPPTATGQGGDRWRGWYVNITKPDGTTEKMPYLGETSTVGSAWMTYTPTEVGDYSIVFSWPGQTLANGTNPDNLRIEYVGDYFEGSTSAPAILHVQQDPIDEWVEPPLPTDYWTRPLNPENREWSTLTSSFCKGSWLRYAHFQEWGQAPNSAHILWAKPIYQYGGIADARYGAVKIGPKDYEDFMPAPIILNGKIYYNAYTYPWYGYYCVDLKTGEMNWFKNGTDNGLNGIYSVSTGYSPAQSYMQLNFGQLYNYYGINGGGVEPYLWMTRSGTPQTATTGGTMWYMVDSMTGNVILSIKNVPGGTSVTDQDGSLLLYNYNANTGQFLCWNSSQIIGASSPTGTSQQYWKPRTGMVLDAVNDTTWQQAGPSSAQGSAIVTPKDILPRSGYTMNVTGPTGLTGTMAILQDKNMVPKQIVFYDFPGTTVYPDLPSTVAYFKMSVLNIKEGGPYNPPDAYSGSQANNHGYSLELVWSKTIQYPVTTGNYTFNIGSSGKNQMIDYDNQVFCLWNHETMQYYGYSLKDGSLLWGPTEPTLPMDYYAFGGFQMDVPASFAYGMLFNAGYGGDLIAYNITTGEKLWSYNATNIGYESPYGGNYPLLTAMIADGKLYEVSGEHSASQPMWRGAHIRCINATNGAELWKVSHFPIGNNDRFLSIADGCIVAGNDYDGQLYCIGKGPSATTVSAPQSGISLGSSFTITGTVKDESAGTKNPSQMAIFPNGAPAVSDDSQEGFMEYLYQQQAYPTNAKGVPVSIDAIDPNGNLVHLGDVTSDAKSGQYSLGVNTDTLAAGTGTYQVISTFAGSNSYGSSNAVSAFTVYSTPTTTPTATAQPITTTTTDLMTYIAVSTIAIIIAIAVVGIMLLKKKP